jgi:hypothetical protein
LHNTVAWSDKHCQHEEVLSLKCFGTLPTLKEYCLTLFVVDAEYRDVPTFKSMSQICQNKIYFHKISSISMEVHTHEHFSERDYNKGYISVIT